LLLIGCLRKPTRRIIAAGATPKFEAQCTVAPIIMPNGDKRWDVLDLDKWIDSLKAGKSSDADEIIARLR
jgi:hypothetical protein